MSLPAEAVQKLLMALPVSRVHKRVGGGGKSLDYIAAHDAIRTANAIFGFGEWGSVVTDLTCVGQEQVVSRDGNKKGYRVGYRCTVLLSVAGCEPTSGVGYGDSMEYNDSSITPHENAAKEAESDALKRALKNYGDQFGLILYAGQGDERQRVEREAAIRRQRALSSEGGSPEAQIQPVTVAEDTRAVVPRAEPPLPPSDDPPGEEHGNAADGSEPSASGGPGGSPASPGPQSLFEPPPDRDKPLAEFTDKRTVQWRTLQKLNMTVVEGRKAGWFDTLTVYEAAHEIAPQLVREAAHYVSAEDGELHWAALYAIVPLWLASQLIDRLEALGQMAQVAS